MDVRPTNEMCAAQVCEGRHGCCGVLNSGICIPGGIDRKSGQCITNPQELIDVHGHAPNMWAFELSGHKLGATIGSCNIHATSSVHATTYASPVSPLTPALESIYQGVNFAGTKASCG